MAVNFNDESFYKAIKIFNELKENLIIKEENIEAYLKTPGISFLKKHLKYYGGIDFDKRVIYYLMKKVLDNSIVEQEDNIFVRSFKTGYSLSERLEESFKKIELDKLILDSINLSNQFLPDKYNHRIKVYFLCGIRGTSIVLDQEIAVDICDEAFIADGEINRDMLIRMLAHEIHHISVESYIKTIVSKINNFKEKVLYEFIGNLISEGTAGYYITNPIDLKQFSSSVWVKNLENVNELLNEIKAIFDKLTSCKDFEAEDTQYLFSENLKGYTAGFVMIKAIDEALGREKVLECIRDCRLFIKYYNMAVEKGSLDLITFE